MKVMTPAQFARIAVAAVRLANEAGKYNFHAAREGLKNDLDYAWKLATAEKPKSVRVKKTKQKYIHIQSPRPIEGLYPNSNELDIARNKSKLDAVKEYKMRTGVTLMDAKYIIESAAIEEGFRFNTDHGYTYSIFYK
jgi:ribosomal protein L7/L12